MPPVTAFLAGLCMGIAVCAYQAFSVMDEERHKAVETGVIQLDGVDYAVIKPNTPVVVLTDSDRQECSPPVEINGEVWPGSCPDEGWYH